MDKEDKEKLAAICRKLNSNGLIMLMEMLPDFATEERDFCIEFYQKTFDYFAFPIHREPIDISKLDCDDENFIGRLKDNKIKGFKLAETPEEKAESKEFVLEKNMLYEVVNT